MPGVSGQPSGGQGIDRSGTVAEKVLFANTNIINSELTLTIANAGTSTAGRIVLAFEDIGYAKL